MRLIGGLGYADRHFENSRRIAAEISRSFPACWRAAGAGRRAGDRRLDHRQHQEQAAAGDRFGRARRGPRRQGRQRRQGQRDRAALSWTAISILRSPSSKSSRTAPSSTSAPQTNAGLAFGSLFGYQNWPIQAAASADIAYSSYEIALVLDTTGSMKGGKLASMKDAVLGPRSVRCRCRSTTPTS